MTAGLAAAGLDDGRCEIFMVTGSRGNLEKVTDTTQLARPVRVWDAQTKRRMNTVKTMIAHYYYDSASSTLQEISLWFASDSTNGKLMRWITFCRVFDAWDKFDHAIARQLLNPYRDVFSDYKQFLAMLLDEGKGHGFELIEDLLRNAERCAIQGRYDDAVGRLYRAIELSAQIWLKAKYEIDTGNIQVDNLDTLSLPSAQRTKIMREINDKGIIKIGLMLAWETIAEIPNDPLASIFKGNINKIKTFLSIRNQSIFAHGLTPIKKTDYERHSSTVAEFLQSVMDTAITARGKVRRISLPQLPETWE